MQKKSLFLYYLVLLIFCETLFKFASHSLNEYSGILPFAFYLICYSLIFFLLSKLLKNKANYMITIVLSFAIIFFYGAQIIYYKIYSSVFSAFSIAAGGAGQVLDFWETILDVCLRNLIYILLLFVPVVLLILFREYFKFSRIHLRLALFNIGFFAICWCLAVLSIFIGGKELYSPYNLFYSTNAPTETAQTLGVMTAMRIDTKRFLFGFTPKITDVTGNTHTEKPTDKPAEVKYNVMSIDFNSLIANEKDKTILDMHKYFNIQTPTKQNEYTDKFKGKNLVLVLAEGFSHYVIDKDLTPTLYKMQNEGYNFKNFYNPIWSVSTSDGEYVMNTGLIPKSGVWSMKESSKVSLPLVLGNQFKDLSYITKSYHNHTYTYYGRDLSHPNMGYDYKGVGNGLNVKKTWPESDLEMVNVTSSEFIGKDKPFITYYVTVSGHLRYTFIGNSMASKNKKLVEHLNYSDNVKAYLSCQIELDRALDQLIKNLEEAGIADDTVIALSADHYPYGLTVDEISELAGHKVETNFELYKSAFLLWHKGITPTTVDKYSCSMDILPTLSNMFGLSYDSRLLMGKDIFSDSEPLVIFSNKSFITDKGKYDAKAKTFTPFSDEPLPEGYVNGLKKEIYDKFNISSMILTNNYYKKILP